MSRPSLAQRFFRLSLTSILPLLCLVLPAAIQAQQLVQVPSGRADLLQEAIGSVANGGVIEVAAGVYTPNSAFVISDGAKGFTIRAAPGALVVLSGGGHDILRFPIAPNSSAPAVAFERLVFSGGRTTENFIGGGLTLVHANAIFTACRFENNSADPSLTGGGAFWIEGGSVSFRDCEWNDNSSKNYGAALSALDARVFLRGCTFRNNRTNLAGHSPTALGGAINNTDSLLQIDNCRFEGNQAGYVGGAIFCGGDWSKPGARLSVNNSLFVGNVAGPYPSQAPPANPLGGAVHMEDNTTAKFVNCRFQNNTAEQGGALSSYRTVTDLDGCVFQGNTATGTIGAAGSGGSIFGISADVPDSSTANGTINRRPVTLRIKDSLFRGQGGGNRDSQHGGAIFVAGDLHAAFGLNGVNQNGSEASNRAVVDLTRTAFVDLTATGTAGAMTGGFVTLTMDQTIVDNCTSTDRSGGLQLAQRSSATITNSTVARCRAASLGAGLAVYATDLHMTGTNLVQNQITGNGNGTAMIVGPISAGNEVPVATDATGLVENCVFANNSGGENIYDSDATSAPFNRLQYGSNTIFPNDRTAYNNDLGGARTVAELNTFSLLRAGGTTTIKAPTPNIGSTSAPVVGSLLMVPPTILQSGAPGESLPIPSYLVYASNGGNATLDGAPQAAGSGVAPTSVNGVHTLTVGSASFSTVPPPSTALNISTRLPVGTGQNVLIGGFIVQGATPKRVIIRAIGPSLPLAGALQDPFLELHDGTGADIGTNDNWRSTQAVDVHASSLVPSNEAESAIVATLNPGAYTAVVRGANNSTGIAVVEAYDLDADRSSKLANIATRGSIQTGDNVMIGGFILGGGTGLTKVLVRGIGPSLGAFGITNPLVDPMLELRNANGALIDSNDDWRTNQALIQSTGLPPTSDAESALLISNPAPGAYTVILRGKNNGTGVGVVEAYVL
jgi:predicted outer membrane repeat protein